MKTEMSKIYDKYCNHIGTREIDASTLELKYFFGRYHWIQYQDDETYRVLFESQISPNVKTYLRHKKVESRKNKLNRIR